MIAPAFQFYPDDWLSSASVTLLTREQEGDYIRLLCYCWREGSIPNDPEKLAVLVGKGATAEQMALLLPLFEIDKKDSARLIHSRLDLERKKQKLHRKKKSNAGKTGANARWANKKQKMATASQSHSDRTDLAMAKNGSSSPSSSPSPSITPIVPEDETPKLVLGAPEPELNLDEFAQEVFDLYPRKDGKAEALRAIRSAFKAIPPLQLREKVQEFASAVAKWPPDQRQFVPWCQKWMNKKRWLDDPTAWVRESPKPTVSALQATLKAKERRRDDLRRKHYSETQSIIGGKHYPAGWRDQSAKDLHDLLKRECEELNQQIAKSA